MNGGNERMTRDLAAAFHRRVRAYENTAEMNDRIFEEFTAATWNDPLLAAHRRHVEAHQLGFGDAAFHAMWLSLLAAAVERFGWIDALEIGVFKGQVISLWSLLAQRRHLSVRVHAITPLAGQPLPSTRWWRSLLYRLSSRFRERVTTGDFYPQENYESIVRQHFCHHGLSFDDVRLVRGLSSAPEVQATVQGERFHVVYIDGDHTFNGVMGDIRAYAPKIALGGWLVMDDAAHDLPGTKFWKGYESVARACQSLPERGFANVLNVGHNRIFERRS